MPGDDRQLVVPAGVAEVPRTDLGAHIPAIERGGRIANPADLEVHVADHGNGIPAQAERAEPAVVRMLDGYLAHRVVGYLVQRDRASGLLHEQREQVEPASRAAAGPAEFASKASDLSVSRIANYPAV